MRLKGQSKRRWNTGDVAYLGTLLGMLIAGAHVFWHVFQGNLPSEDSQSSGMSLFNNGSPSKACSKGFPKKAETVSKRTSVRASLPPELILEACEPGISSPAADICGGSH
jgi:hypothetical protein